MIGLKAKQKRFSLYYLEENELYTQDLSGFCIIVDNETQKEKFCLISSHFLNYFDFQKRKGKNSHLFKKHYI